MSGDAVTETEYPPDTKLPSEDVMMDKSEW